MPLLKLSADKETFIDDEDLDRLSSYKWSYNTLGYAVAWINKRLVYLHRFILNPKNREEIDHINGNGLDNRKANLRICFHRQNIANQKIRKDSEIGVKGVHRHGNKWRARIAGGRHLGLYKTVEEAARAYDEAAKVLYGKFARLNNI